ncbi:MAG TPA: site-specific integrase, partial [Gemmatales bacterium]|nr:site-specific integrase [Gemmatales bacterium]
RTSRRALVVGAALASFGISGVLEGSQTYRLMCRELLKAESVIAGKIKERAQGDYGKEYYNYGNGQASSAAALLPPSTAGGPLLSACIPDYLKHFEHRAPGTLEAKRNILKRFLEVIGDRSVGSIGKQDCIAYRDTARKLPSNASKKFPGLSLKAVLERAKGLPEGELLSKQTINQDLTHLGHFFSWLINEGRTTGSNPVDGLAYEGIESKSHESFSDSDIKLVFGSSEFRKQKADTKYSSRYWLPLILLHTGARREEIANLALADIRQEEGIHFFDVTPDLERGRRLKNKSSKRRVPIHSHLIKLGFLDYVESRRSKGETLVFSKAAKKVGEGGRETVGDSVSKWFHRLLLRAGVNGKKSLHGLRATVNTKLHEAGCDGEVRRELLGHSGKDVNETVYLRLSLKTLSDGLERLEFKV